MHVEKLYRRLRLIIGTLALLVLQTSAESLGLVSQRSPQAVPTETASGDSSGPVVSADGRFVLFASTAFDLISSNPAPAQKAVGVLNVYVRDRITRETKLVSVNGADTGPANGDSVPITISADDRYVLFESLASDIAVRDTNNASDVFVRDLVLGVTRLVSINTNGAPGNHASSTACMTPDARYVAFVSSATDLLANDTNGLPNIFVRDMQSGTTFCASAAGQAVAGAGACDDPILSIDGRYVAFFSTATNLAPPAANIGNGFPPGDIYVADVLSGQTVCASTNARNMGGPPGAACLNHALSGDGTIVTFSCSGNIFSYNVTSGITTRVTTAAVSETSFTSANGLDVTPDGRFVAFIGSARTNLLRWDAKGSNVIAMSFPTFCMTPQIDPSGRLITVLINASTNSASSAWNMVQWDIQNGITNVINVDNYGSAVPILNLAPPSLSTNAQLIAYDCRDASIITNDSNHSYDVILRDMSAGTNELISAHDPSVLSISPNAFTYPTTLSVSSNGQVVAFESAADNLIPNDTNPSAYPRIFMRDLRAGTNCLINAGLNAVGMEPQVSGNGRYVVFTARATNIYDVYLYDAQTGASTLVSISTNGLAHGAPADASYSPSVSADGRFVLFQSLAVDMTTGANSTSNHYVRDLQLGTTTALTTNSSNVSFASMTPDGHYIALGFSSGTPGLSVYDTQVGTFIITNAASGISAVAISADGSRFAYVNATGLCVVDKESNTARQVVSYFNSKRPGLKFTRDGRFLVYATKHSSSDTNTDVWLYDYLEDTNLLISKSFLSGDSAGGTSDSPDITPDGRYIAFRGDSPSLLPGDTNGAPDIFVFDRLANSIRLVSTDFSGHTYGNSRSVYPRFSGDSGSLIFGSSAGNLVANDLNQFSDVFIASLATSAVTDSDGDGMDDAWELQYFGTLARDGTGDFDGDGVSDRNEFQAGTDPTNPASYFLVQFAPPISFGSPMILSWLTSPKKAYIVEYKNALSDTSWTPLPQGSRLVGNRAYAYDLSPPNARFYRVRLL